MAPDMVLKMLGINPDELKSQFGDKMQQVQDTVARFDAKLDTIIQNQQIMYRLMVTAKMIPTVEDYNKLALLENATDGNDRPN